jgi:hypothetical protein
MVSELKPRLTAERLREMLDYAPRTGLFYWRKRRGNMAAGLEAGGFHKRYLAIRIDGVHHLAHRLAWLYVHGKHPSEEIDHRNGNPADNRIANLRECSHAQNARNVGRRRNRSGFKGVSPRGRKWIAQIGLNGRTIYLGLFATAQKAADAYDEAARLYHGEFARTNAQIAAELIGQATTVRRMPNAPPQLAPCRALRLDAQPRSGAMKALLLETTSLPLPGNPDRGYS